MPLPHPTRTFTLALAIAVAFAAAIAGFPTLAQPLRIEGHALAIDGDTLRIGAERIRLMGIDAPERGQSCGSGQSAWPCGDRASAELQNLVSGRLVTCIGNGRDRYDRTLAVCHADGYELNDILARSGYAVATPEYSPRYLGAEAEARRNRLGIWAGSFMHPAEFRRQQRSTR